jgi:hypothetical protein
MFPKQMLNHFKLWFYALIITMFYKFRTYFQNVVIVLDVKVLDIRNYLTLIDDLYRVTKCILCKVVTILRLNIIIESLVLYFRLPAAIISPTFVLSLSHAVFVDFQENTGEGIVYMEVTQ